jgi:cellulose synthase/poly-beta-1,6-N-acetylglucosamine synthase-like glycosyltransferase
MTDVLHDLVVWFSVAMVVYFALLNLNYFVLTIVGWNAISDYVKRRDVRDYAMVEGSALSVPVSVLVPAFNEAPVIEASVRGLFALNYRQFEVVVINDGSTDGTLEELKRAFALVEVERVPRADLKTADVRGVYVSPTEERLVVIDKENGGKADALNTGLRYARYPLFCAVDSDTMLEPDSLGRLVWQFQAEPETVASGGIVRIVNGSTLRDGRVATVQTPKNLLVNVQIVEYLRAFLAGRLGWSRLQMLLIISGAFGLFRRDVVIDAGGYDPDTVGEDAELVFRLHRHCREQGRPYKLSFIADPVCWTEAPTSMRVLTRQRDRWQRGLIQSMLRHRVMIGRRRYGAIGLVAMPYFVIFEMLGPLIEIIGYASFALSAALGWLDGTIALLLFGLSVVTGLLFSFGALAIEERAFQRYPRWRCLGRLCLAAFVENFGYRQWMTFVRARAYLTLIRGDHSWGEMTRSGYATDDGVPEVPAAT